jgi:SAM-dependent methyltransferase
MIILKEIAQNALMAIPAVRRFAQRFHSTGLNNDPTESRHAFDFLSGGEALAGLDVLEIGPGQTMRVLQYALDAGARSCTAVDIVDYLEEKRADFGRIRFEIYDGRNLPIPNSSVDRIWSFDVFEHLRHPEQVVRECHRVLRAGGRMVCQVDVRDHYVMDETRLADHLRYPRWAWNAMTWNRSAFTNRLRYSDWLELFRRVGFRISDAQPHASDVLRRERARKAYLHRFSEDDVATTSFRAWLEKP